MLGFRSALHGEHSDELVRGVEELELDDSGLAVRAPEVGAARPDRAATGRSGVGQPRRGPLIEDRRQQGRSEHLDPCRGAGHLASLHPEGIQTEGRQVENDGHDWSSMGPRVLPGGRSDRATEHAGNVNDGSNADVVLASDPSQQVPLEEELRCPDVGLALEEGVCLRRQLLIAIDVHQFGLPRGELVGDLVQPSEAALALDPHVRVEVNFSGPAVQDGPDLVPEGLDCSTQVLGRAGQGRVREERLPGLAQAARCHDVIDGGRQATEGTGPRGILDVYTRDAAGRPVSRQIVLDSLDDRVDVSTDVGFSTDERGHLRHQNLPAVTYRVQAIEGNGDDGIVVVAEGLVTVPADGRICLHLTVN